MGDAIERTVGRRCRGPLVRLLGLVLVLVGIFALVGSHSPAGLASGTVMPGASADPADPAGPPGPTRPPPLSPLRVLTPFAPPASPYSAGHRGVDLAGQAGQQVVASTPGTVAFAGTVAGVQVVSIDIAGGWRLTYEPIAPTVRAGSTIHQGEAIGTLLGGHPGCPEVACLHWGLVVRSGPPRVYADPLLLLRRVTVRLLPWEGEPVRPP